MFEAPAKVRSRKHYFLKMEKLDYFEKVGGDEDFHFNIINLLANKDGNATKSLLPESDF